MDAWLDCKISLGQFSGEFAVNGETFDGSPFSLFAAADYLEFAREPEPRQRVEGQIRVQVIQEKDNLMLVRLPQQTLENGYHITVNAVHVHQEA